MLKIGQTVLPRGVLLAPMAGVSDRAFRLTAARYGAEYAVCEMVSAKALCYEQIGRHPASRRSKTAPLADIYTDECPTAVQIFGADPEFMARAATLLLEGSYFDCRREKLPAAIDINMGCPVAKVVSCGEGSALMKNPLLAEKITSAVVKAVSPTLHVTVKIRAGWDNDSKNAVEVAKAVEAAGACAVTVHGRTKTQMYAPGVDLSVIAAVKNALSVPVIGNGDIFTASDALEMFSKTGCDGIMVARGALGNPWIFAEIKAALSGTEYLPPSRSERLEMALCQLYLAIDDKGEKIAVAEARKHLSWYIKGFPGASVARAAINNAETLADMKSVIENLKIY